MKTVKLKITGKVQGVFYRANSRDQANKLGLSGYAKNMNDGSVEVLLQGNKENIEDFIEWAVIGPEMAEVKRVEIIKIDYENINIVEVFLIH